MLANLDYAPLVAEGTITTIHAPLFKPDCAANCQPVPNFTLKVDRLIFGESPGQSLTVQKFVFSWPADLVSYKEGVRCVLLLQKTTYTNELALLSVLPAGQDNWSGTSSRDELKQQIKAHLIAQLSENATHFQQAGLIHTLSILLNPSEAEKLFHPFVTSPEKWVRHAAIGALVCKAPTTHNIDTAKKDIEPTLTETRSDRFCRWNRSV